MFQPDDFQGLEHFRPDGGVAGRVFGDESGFELELEADAPGIHGTTTCRCSMPSRDAAALMSAPRCPTQSAQWWPMPVWLQSVHPESRVPAEVHPGGRIADRQERAGHHFTFGGDEHVAAVRVLAEAERGDRAVPDVEFDRDAPAALAVEDAEAAQQRILRGHRQVGGAVVAHLHHVVEEVQGLDFSE